MTFSQLAGPMFVNLKPSESYAEVTVRSPPGLDLPRDEPNKALAQPRAQPIIGDLFLACANGGNPMLGSESEQRLAPSAYAEGMPMSILPCNSVRLSAMQSSDCGSSVTSVLASSRPPAPSFGRSNQQSGLLGSVQLEAEAKDSSVQKGKQHVGNDGPNKRWWAQPGPGAPHLCPLNNFPISWLPYPPFKLRVDPTHSNRHRLVDGKSLALQVCISHNITVCGRKLWASDLAALDDYVVRCKLGSFRPRRAAFLLSAVQAASDEKARQHALKEHESFVNAARIELGILRTIQKKRMSKENSVMSRQRQAIASQTA